MDSEGGIITQRVWVAGNNVSVITLPKKIREINKISPYGDIITVKILNVQRLENVDLHNEKRDIIAEPINKMIETLQNDITEGRASVNIPQKIRRRKSRSMFKA